MVAVMLAVVEVVVVVAVEVEVAEVVLVNFDEQDTRDFES